MHMAENDAGNIDQSKLRLVTSKVVDARVAGLQNAELREYLLTLSEQERKRYVLMMDKNEQLRSELEKVTTATEEFMERER